MFFTFSIFLFIAGCAIAIMAVIAMRHWKELRILDPESIQQERERQRREELLLQRLARLKKNKLGPILAVLQRAVLELKKMYHAAYLSVVRLEKFYTQAKAPFAMMAPSVRERVKLLLSDARSLARDLKWADAERRFLEVLTIDAQNVEAYKGLGGVYLKQKLYVQARETFEFILKRRKADDTCYAALADIAFVEGNLGLCEAMRRKAVEIRPRLANCHADLAEFYLSQHTPTKAWPFAKRASDLDPKSPKYLELSLEAAILVGDRKEVRRRYDKLRLLSEDRSKLQALKERIDAMSESSPSST